MKTYMFKIKLADGRTVVGTTNCYEDDLEDIIDRVTEQIDEQPIECTAREVVGTQFIIIN